jgi:hypothetical protein
MTASDVAAYAGAGGISAATLAEAAAGTLNTVYASPQTAVPKDASGMAGAALLPGSAAAYSGTPVTGMIRYNNSTPPAVIEYYSGSGWVALGSPAATLAEAAAGTINTKFSSPETAVPKNAAGMTGAAILPGGTTAQQPAGAASGWLRYNSTIKSLEFYTNSKWLPITYGSDTGSITIESSATAPTTRPNGDPLQPGDIYYNTTTGQTFGWNGTAWIPFDQRNIVVTGANYTAKANDYVVVSASAKTITLPASPIPGTYLTIVVAGTWLDTVVNGNGENIMSSGTPLTLNSAYASIEFTYVDAVNGWRLS